MEYSDEILMAFADGELDEARAQEVARAVEGDAQLAARVAGFRRSREMLATAFAAERADGADDPLAAMIRAAGQGAAAGPATPPPAANMNWRPLALAASLALAVVAVGWVAMPGREAAPQQAAVLHSELRAALSRVSSGQTEQLGGYDFTAIASFTNREGELCREYETATPGRIQVGVACHDGDGWTGRFSAPVAVDGNSYVTASGEIEGLDAYIASTGMGEPLTEADEDAALNALP
ncbi:MAG: hypothetical protein Q4G36_09055 [Paracoccus sp. (in: a-proteobacteria)]|nr:hypothetical protein [Paracoccus sp. (in: a-proteobacteria)]